MSYPITHITVRDILPENKTIRIGEIYPIAPKVEDTSGLAFVHDDDRRGKRPLPPQPEEAEEEDLPEAKVVKRGRRPSVPKVAEVAETK